VRLSPAEMTALAASLRTNTHLKALDLSECFLDKEDRARADAMGAPFRRLVKVLCNHPNLWAIILSHNDLEGKEVSVLADQIRSSRRTSRSLKVLGLLGNSIGDDGAKALARCLSDPNCSIRSLNLSFCCIGDNGCRAIASALRKNASLIHLNMYLNKTPRLFGTIQKLSPTRECVRQFDSALRCCNYALEEFVCHYGVGTDVMAPAKGVSCTDVAKEQLDDIQVLCVTNRRAKEDFARLANGKQLESIPPALWPDALSRLSRKPDLLFSAIKMKPELLCTAISSNKAGNVCCVASSNSRRGPVHPPPSKIGVFLLLTCTIVAVLALLVASVTTATR